MKRVVMFMSLLFVLHATSAYPAIVRDAELGAVYTFEDNAKIALQDFKFVDEINATGKNISSASDEEFALIRAKITNLRNENFTFGEAMTVMVFYGNKDISYTGSVGQFSFDKPEQITQTQKYIPYPVSGLVNINSYEPVGKMYSREFALYCKLPKNIIYDDAPLRMTIKIVDDEINYNIRK